jgi:hypothetical protein
MMISIGAKKIVSQTIPKVFTLAKLIDGRSKLSFYYASSTSIFQAFKISLQRFLILRLPGSIAKHGIL